LAKDNQPVCVVTFNYDQLIEHALNGAGITTAQLSDYIASPRFKLFKVHGSIRWVRYIRAKELPIDQQQWTATNLVIENVAALDFSDDFAIASSYPSGFNDNKLVAPAIAIPLEDKTAFECPSDHLDLLKKILPQTDRFLIIGWQATERHFLHMLRGSLMGPVSGHTVVLNSARSWSSALR
jgi:hypothetical protein